ncbi:MAG: FAD-dependent oxidoreductase [bacterium]
MISLTINDQKIQVEEGTTLLEAARGLNINIPTLCYHKALSPYGACRLCIVEISAGGRSWLSASCLYPAQEGLVIKTHSERVIKARRIVAELLLARVPSSLRLQELAKELGVTQPRVRLKNKDCTLCGLCVRICQERMGIGVVSFVNRGSDREVTPPFDTLSDICQTCGACISICPTGRIKIEDISKARAIPLLSEFDEGLRRRSPIYVSYPQAVPNWPVIDKDYCVHILKDKCGICQDVCEAGAIDYEQKESKIELDVGSIILVPGFDKFNPRLKYEYGYGRYKNVITSLELERILSASGPFAGHLQRLSDGKEPRHVAFIQCVGSRDCQVDSHYCSSVCCTYAIKEAIIAKEHAQTGLETTIFYMDVRTYGKGFEEYYRRARDEYGVKFVKGRVAGLKEVKDHNLILRYTSEFGKILKEEFDLVILSIGLRPNEEMKSLAKRLGIRLNQFGFARTPEFSPVETTRPGIFVAGAFQGPKDIPETVMQGSGAASKAGVLLAETRGTEVLKKTYPPESDVSGQEPRIGVFICHCGINIGGVVDIPSVVEYAKTLANVVYAENNLYTCSEDTQKKIKEKVKEERLNRVIVASCTPRTHEPLFRETCRDAGLNPYLFEMANIRDQCSWVHMNEPEKATRKAKDLVRIAVAKSRLLEPLYGKILKVNHNALVIGGGISGMRAALDLADGGFKVSLVEKEAELGGNLRHIHYLLDGSNPREMLKGMIDDVKRSKNIEVHVNASILKVEGSFGNFSLEIRTKDETRQIDHGVVIVATGAAEYKPTEYLYGEDSRIITQRELEERLAADRGSLNLSSVVMIQCVGSREEGRPYCSRLCCNQALKNALKIKEISAKTNVYILYRDIRSYGFKEIYYAKAREEGVLFIRYDEDRRPEVRINRGVEDSLLEVEVFDPILQRRLTINPDLVVLSAAIIPNPENKEIGQMFKIPLDQNGFFLEAHMKLRPVDFATEGIYMAGLCHSPKDIPESISQASSAAGRATTIISKDEITLEATLSFVVDENCDGCAYCIDPCPYKALTLIEYMKNGAIKKTVESDESKCKGCGVCMATCPKKGIYVKGFKLEMLQAMVEAALETTV